MNAINVAYWSDWWCWLDLTEVTTAIYGTIGMTHQVDTLHSTIPNPNLAHFLSTPSSSMLPEP